MKFLRRQSARALWQRLLRAGLLAGLVVLLAYALLPWWMPAGWVRSRIEADLSRALGVEVRVGEVDCSWARMKIDSLELIDPSTRQRMVMIEELRCEYAPLRVLAGRKLRWLELRHVWAHVDFPSKATPRPRLLKMLSDASTLRGILNVQRISIRGAELRLHAADLDRDWLLEVGEVQMNRGETTPINRMSFTARLVQDGNDAVLAGRLLHQKAEGELQVAAMGLDLQELPLERFGISRESLSGQSSLRGIVRLGENLHIDHAEMSFEADSLDVTTAHGRVRAPRAAVAFEARLPAGADQIELQNVTLSLPGIALSGRAVVNAGILVGDPAELREVQLAGTVDPAPAAKVFAMDALAPLELSKPVDVSLVVRPGEEGLGLKISADASEASMRWAGRAIKPVGRTAQLALAATRIAGRWQLHPGRMDFGNNAVIINRGQEAAADSGLRGVIGSGTADLVDLPAVRDLLGERLALDPLEGSLRVIWNGRLGRVASEPISGEGWQATLKAQLLSPRTETLRLGEFLQKPAGGEMTMDLSLNAHREGLDSGEATLRYAGGEANLLFHSTPKQPGCYRGTLRADHVERLLSSYPRYVQSTADIRGSVSAKGVLAADALTGTATLDKVQIRIPGVWYKPLEEPLSIAQTSANPESMEWVISTPSATATIAIAPDDTLCVQVRSTDLSKLATRCAPVAALFSAAPSGKAEAHLALVKPHAKNWSATGKLDLHAKGRLANWLGGMELDGRAVSLIGALDARRAEVKLTTPVGHLQASGQFAQVMTPHTLRAAPGLNVLSTVTVSAAASTRDLLDALPKRWVNPLLRAVSGPMTLEGVVTLGEIPSGRVHCVGKLAGTLGRMKLAGNPITVEVEVAPSRDKKTAPVSGTVTLPGLSATAAATLHRKESSFVVRDLTSRMKVGDAFLALLPPLAPKKLRGSAMVALASTEPATGVLDLLSLTMDKTTLSYRTLPMGLSGAASFEELDLHTGEFSAATLKDVRWDIDRGHATLNGTVTYQRDSVQGKLALVATGVDLPKALDSLLVTPPKARISRMETQSATAGAKRDLARMAKIAKTSKLQLDLSASKCTLPDLRLPFSYPVETLTARLLVAKGTATATTSATLLSGTASGKASIAFGDPHPALKLKQSMETISITDVVAPQIPWDFPGNSASGTLTRHEDLHVGLAQLLARCYDRRLPAIYTGTVKTIATKGALEGPSAPAGVAKVFPGLNLTKYTYDSMHRFTTIDATGKQQNEILFRGTHYNLYSVGTISRDRAAEYSLGLVLLPAPADSVHLHRDWKQGRVPLLTYRGTIEQGVLQNPIIRYSWSRDSLAEVFLTNNLLYRAWLNWKSDPKEDSE
ncbi:MAG: hypothetical protein HN909_07190 [Phycisphaerales bacterium]|nr:hypothetical protein [Phycisphaerales bacterium]MBT7171536.1 hypothetical protein [Phycisphaerales bacterium]